MEQPLSNETKTTGIKQPLSNGKLYNNLGEFQNQQLKVALTLKRKTPKRNTPWKSKEQINTRMYIKKHPVFSGLKKYQ